MIIHTLLLVAEETQSVAQNSWSCELNMATTMKGRPAPFRFKQLMLNISTVQTYSIPITITLPLNTTLTESFMHFYIFSISRFISSFPREKQKMSQQGQKLLVLLGYLCRDSWSPQGGFTRTPTPHAHTHTHTNRVDVRRRA